MAQRISPLQPTINTWLSAVEVENPCLSFRDKWVRCHTIALSELALAPWSQPHLPSAGFLLGTQMHSFGRSVGSFFCIIRPGTGEIPLSISAPTFSQETIPELERALLTALWKIAPTGTRLEVKLEDDPSAELSPLAAAGRFTDAGWILVPAETQLIREEPRLWIFCFRKIC